MIPSNLEKLILTGYATISNTTVGMSGNIHFPVPEGKSIIILSIETLPFWNQYAKEGNANLDLITAIASLGILNQPEIARELQSLSYQHVFYNRENRHIFTNTPEYDTSFNYDTSTGSSISQNILAKLLPKKYDVYIPFKNSFTIQTNVNPRGYSPQLFVSDNPITNEGIGNTYINSSPLGYAGNPAMAAAKLDISLDNLDYIPYIQLPAAGLDNAIKQYVYPMQDETTSAQRNTDGALNFLDGAGETLGYIWDKFLPIINIQFATINVSPKTDGYINANIL